MQIHNNAFLRECIIIKKKGGRGEEKKKNFLPEGSNRQDL